MGRMNNRLARVALCLAVAAGSAAPALAQEFQPYPSPKVTVEQYVAYAKQVQDSLGETAEILQGMNLVAFSDMRTRTFYIFTTKDHPAHPAWITRQMDEEGGQVHVQADRLLRGLGSGIRQAVPLLPGTERAAPGRSGATQSVMSVAPFSGFRLCPTPQACRIA